MNTAASLPHTLRKASHCGPALRANRRCLGVPRELFAALAHCSIRKLATYENVESLPAHVARQVSEAMRLLVALKEIIGDGSELRRWLEMENPAFDGRTPLQVIKQGETDLLWAMVHEIRTGAFA